jgi:hypothetical protein
MVSRVRGGPTAKGSLGLDAILQALHADGAIVSPRRLADRDPEWGRVIETMAKDLLDAVDAGDVEAAVLAEWVFLPVEAVWDRTGPQRNGHSDVDEIEHRGAGLER